MSQRTLMFLAQGGIVIAITLFHIQSARIVIRHAMRAGVGKRGLWWVMCGIIIAAVDLPLIHSFIFYKLFHPVWIDEIMRLWAPVQIAIGANISVIGLIVLLHEYLHRPLRSVTARGRRREKADQIPVTRFDGVITSDGVPVASAFVPSVSLGNDDTTMNEGRRRFLWRGGLALAGAATGATALSAMDTTDDHVLEQIVVKIPNLPEGLKGTTIALITDIHSSVFMARPEMESYANAVNNLRADMIIVAGDFVNSKVREVYPFAEAFSGLKAPLGVYGVTGNHDYYSGDIETVAREVEQAGIKLLRNNGLTIEKGGQKLWLMGMDDSDIYDIKPYLQSGKTERLTIEKMLSGAPDGVPRLFVCHKPYPFEEYSQLGVDLMLSGHTHGGQVVLGKLDNVNLSFASLASSYVSGLYRARSNRRSQLYVSRGVGTVGIPMRLNCPPEITHIVLV